MELAVAEAICETLRKEGRFSHLWWAIPRLNEALGMDGFYIDRRRMEPIKNERPLYKEGDPYKYCGEVYTIQGLAQNSSGLWFLTLVKNGHEDQEVCIS